MRITYLFFTSIFLSTSMYGQFTSPNTGVYWTLDSIAAYSPTTVLVTDSTYTITENVTMEAEDSLVLNANLKLLIAPDVEVRVKGFFISSADSITITALDTLQQYKGFWFESDASVVFKNTLIQYGGGLRVVTPDFVMDSCEMSYNGSGSSTGGAIGFSNGNVVVRNSVFKYNFNPALSSGANVSCPALIEGNYFEGNNQRNNNRPQINMGPSGALDSIRIINNTVIGDRNLTMVGGISASSLTGVVNKIVVTGNIVKDNRYAITTLGPNTTGRISYNILEDNNTEVNPNNGGSGISLYNTGLVYCTGNEIRRNLWGVTIIGTALANLGSDDEEDFNPGENIFSENMNGGVTYALYNNTPNEIKALHNCWIEGQESTLEEAGEVIYDVADIEGLGEVLYDPISCAMISSVSTFDELGLKMYPNPAKSYFMFESDFRGDLYIFDLNGRMLHTERNVEGLQEIKVDLPSGLYIIEYVNPRHRSVEKLFIE